MWLFRHKYLADGTLSRYKARLVTNGSAQIKGVDVDDTFSLVVKPASSKTLLQQIIASLHQEFSMTDLGPLNYFLGISVTRDSFRMFLSHRKYAVEIPERSHMGYCNPSQTHVDTKSKLGYDGDLAFKRQPMISRSSAKAYECGVANAVVETCWLRNLLRELYTPLSFATFVYFDNVSVVYLSSNPVQHQHMKYIEIDIHFVRDLIAAGQVHVLHVPSRYQYADIFTKGLSSALFEEFCFSLSIRCPPTPTAGKCWSILVVHLLYSSCILAHILVVY
nr:ribonuclease H-like domain-containing protein [Tanacetum cinerariifolium]